MPVIFPVVSESTTSILNVIESCVDSTVFISIVGFLAITLTVLYTLFEIFPLESTV